MQTIYRWWPSKADVLLDALATTAEMVHAQIDAEFGDRFRASFLHRRRDALTVIVDRAKDRGDLPATLSPGTVADIGFGVIWYRMLATRQTLDHRLIDKLVHTLAATHLDTTPSTRRSRKTT
jgi:AcrR family transcriptional regulator